MSETNSDLILNFGNIRVSSRFFYSYCKLAVIVDRTAHLMFDEVIKEKNSRLSLGIFVVGLDLALIQRGAFLSYATIKDIFHKLQLAPLSLEEYLTIRQQVQLTLSLSNEALNKLYHALLQDYVFRNNFDEVFSVELTRAVYQSSKKLETHNYLISWIDLVTTALFRIHANEHEPFSDEMSVVDFEKLNAGISQVFHQ